MEFTYKPNLEMNEKQRYNNPLGFQVVEYTVDNDYAASPPVENPVAAGPQAQAGYPVQGAVPGQPYPGQPVPGQPVPGQPMPGQPYPGQPVQGQPVPGPGGPRATSRFRPRPTSARRAGAAPQQYPAAPAGTVPAGQPQAPNQVNGVGTR